MFESSLTSDGQDSHIRLEKQTSVVNKEITDSMLEVFLRLLDVVSSALLCVCLFIVYIHFCDLFIYLFVSFIYFISLYIHFLFMYY